MTTWRKQLSPALFLIVLFGINALIWITYMRSVFLAPDIITTAVMGSSLIIGFSLVFFLATRNRIIVKIFGGLENLYIWHRMLAIVVALFVFVHGYFAVARGLRNIPDVIILGNAMNAGEFARNVFLGLIFFALFAKFMKYEIFRYIHRLLLIPFIFALYHGFFTSVVDLFSFNIVSIWMIAISLCGLFSSLYMILIYQKTAFRYKGEIIEKQILNESILELKIRIDQKYFFKPGQFAFIKVFAKSITKDPHPFSISSSDDKYITFTIKSLGDFTNALYEKLQVPANVKITRPFGDMTFDSHMSKQIWIAGGIGITPFLGYLRTNQSFDKNIQLIYSVRKRSEAVHLDTLEQLAKIHEKFSFKLHDTEKDGFLTAKELNFDGDTILYMCGPRPMVLALEKQMKEHHAKTPIVYEAFSFTGTLVEDIYKFFKKIIKKKRP